MKKTQGKVAIVVPVYNEAENLRILIPKIYDVLPKPIVCIVDDNSEDETARIISNLQKKHKSLQHLKRKRKLGRGTAVMFGFSRLFKDKSISIFIEMDADLSHDPKELPKLIKLVNTHTFAIASRYIKRSKIVNSPLKRRLLSKAANSFNTFLFGIPVHDNTNGFRAYPREAIAHLLKYKFKSSGFVTITESTYYLYKKGLRPVEMPTKFVNRRIGGSKADLHEIYISLRDLIKIRLGN